jgi:SAM-dependent methyltransferase
MSFTTGTEAYGRFVGRYSPALATALCDFAGVAAGDTVLDVGCGPGPLLAEVARRVGVEHVAGVDPSEPFVEACRAAIPGADVRVAGAEQLPLPDRSFDVALSQLVVNFMSDPLAGVSEMRRVARRVVASCVWDYAGEMTMLRTFWDAAVELDPSAPDEGRTMAYCTSDELAALWEAAGLGRVTTSPLVASADYAGFDDYWSPFLAGVGPAGAYCASLDEDRRADLREGCFRHLGSPDGPFSLRARAWAVRGEVEGPSDAHVRRPRRPRGARLRHRR